MEDLFRTIFEAFPEKASIFFTGECSDCGQAVTIEIIPTSGGFGLSGGALVEYSRENYAPKCADCYKANGKMVGQYKVLSKDSLMLDKKDLLNIILANHKWMRK
jgi:hypothetical protein